MEYSSCQKEIFRVYNTTNKNIVVNASPGSGKSFTMLELAKQTPAYKRCIFLAFNKSIAEENKRKLPNYINSSTLHSLGYKSLFKLVHSSRFMVNEIKTFIIARKRLTLANEGQFKNEKAKNKYLFELSKIYDLYRINLVQDKDELEELCMNYDIEVHDDTINDTWNLIQIMKEEDMKILNGKENMLDFTDMLWLTTYFPEDQFSKYDVAFLDECQDVNPLQKSLFEKIIKKNGRSVIVGDRKQMIYAFQGSNFQSFQDLLRRPNTIELPLDVSYRCSKKVIEASNLIFPDQVVYAYETNPLGTVRSGRFEEIDNGDFVLCRNNRPLVEMFIDLLKINKSAHIYGKDYGESLLKLLEEVEKMSDNEVKQYFDDKLKKTGDMLRSKGISNVTNHPQYVNLLERIIILDILHKEFLTYRDVNERIKSLFTDVVNGGITLMTCHKSKGLEADRVFFMNPELIPSPYAQSQNMLFAEKCLYYVAMTRARQELIYLGTSGVGVLRKEVIFDDNPSDSHLEIE